MPYTPTNWTDGSTPVTASNMNHLETSYAEATSSFNPDVFTSGFVLTGLACTKDGTTASQLDMTAGTAYLLQSDGTTRQHKLTAQSFTMIYASATEYLDLNPDGSLSLGTSHTTQSNYIPLCSVTTDASGNILTVTDARPLVAFAYPAAAGAVAANALASTQAAQAYLQEVDTGTDIYDNLLSRDTGARKRHLRANSGNNVAVDFLVGNTDGSVTVPGAVEGVAGQPTAGSFGVPVIVAQTINRHVTGTGGVGVVTFTPPTDGLYRFSGSLTLNNGTSGQKPAAWAYYTDPNTAASISSYLQAVAGQVTVFSGNNTVANGAYPFPPLVAYCKAGLQIGINYQDGAGTPNDYISAIIERLS